MQIPRWLTWVPFTPIVFYAAERFPFRRDRLARSDLDAHLDIAIAIVDVIEVVWLQISFFMQGYLEPEVLARMRAELAPRCIRSPSSVGSSATRSSYACRARVSRPR